MPSRSNFIMLASLALAAMAAGCSSVDKTPPPPRVAVPPEDTSSTTVVRPDIKPLPAQPLPDDGSRPPFDDVPLVTQRPPEQRAYVDAYARVGRPRIVVFVNRTLEGEVLPANLKSPVATIDRRITSSGNINIESHDSRDTTGKFSTNGPADVRDTTDIYLHPGQYDEAATKSIDYEAMESILTDWLSAGGKVAIVSPTLARQRLSDQQVKDLQSGRPQVLGEAARQLDADVIVQAQAHPTRQTERGLEIRMIVEAISVKGGESIARAVVDIPPPLDKPQLNKYTRFVARKLMDGMTSAWDAFGGPPAAEQTPPAAPREQSAPAVVAPPPAPPQPPTSSPPPAAPPAPPAPARSTPSDFVPAVRAPQRDPAALAEPTEPKAVPAPSPASAPSTEPAPSTRPAGGSATGNEDFGPGVNAGAVIGVVVEGVA